MKLNGASIATIAIAPHEEEEDEELDEDGNPIIRDEEGNIVENVDAQEVVEETPTEE